MTLPYMLILVMVVMFGTGFYLMLDRVLTRVLLGFLLVGNATNLMIFTMSGTFGGAPLFGDRDVSHMSDPLPQAFILTAIVITFGVSAFLLALIYRSWRLASEHDDQVRNDTVHDDEADLEIAKTEALTSVEVTEEDLEEAEEFDTESEEETR